MKKFKSHKTVHAAKITNIVFFNNNIGGANLTFENDEWIRVEQNYLNKHEPHIGGYYVQYDDGYESFSPANAFESGYTEEELLTTEEHTKRHSNGDTAIKGYKEQDPEQIHTINEIKAMEINIGKLMRKLIENRNRVDVDMRWYSIARTNLQSGFMQLVRSIAQPPDIG